MSRLRLSREEQLNAARHEFQTEMKTQMVRRGMIQEDLGRCLGVTTSGASRTIAVPDSIKVERLRKIIETLDIEPMTVLALLGYDIKKIKKEMREDERRQGAV